MTDETEEPGTGEIPASQQGGEFSEQSERVTICSEWRDIIGQLNTSDEDKRESVLASAEYPKARTRYLDLLDESYAQFVAEGPVEPGGIKDHLLTWCRFNNFIDETIYKDEVTWKEQPSRYDFGYKFLVDALLNGDGDISDEWRERFRDFFDSIAPYYNHAPLLSTQAINKLIDTSPNRDELIRVAMALAKRFLKQRLITRDEMDNESNAEWRSIFRIGEYNDATYNPSLDNLCFIPLLESLGINFWETVGREAKEEYKREFEAEFKK